MSHASPKKKDLESELRQVRKANKSNSKSLDIHHTTVNHINRGDLVVLSMVFMATSWRKDTTQHYRCVLLLTEEFELFGRALFMVWIRALHSNEKTSSQWCGTLGGES